MTPQFDDQHTDSAMFKLLDGVTAQLALFLETVLPPLFEDWWNHAVISSLSFQQMQHVERRGIGSLAELDLAALLCHSQW